MPNNKNRNTIVTASINTKAIKRANKYLGSAGYRICIYTGELLTLTSKNFHRMASDQFGFQPVSKVGKAIYNSDGLLAKTDVDQYYRNLGSTTELV